MANRTIVSAASTFALAGVFAFAPFDANVASASSQVGQQTSGQQTIVPQENHDAVLNPSTDVTERGPGCYYDFDHDGMVGFGDYLLLIELMSVHPEWSYSPRYTFDDIIGLISAWGDC